MPKKQDHVTPPGVDLLGENRYGVSEAAKILGLSRSAVYAAIKSSRIGHYAMTGNAIRIGEHHILAFLLETNREAKLSRGARL